MKQTINKGATVDDLTGDYLRIGAEKLENNFKEIYDDLGDGLDIHAAGAWKTYKSGGTLQVKFGESWIIDTTTGSVVVELPSTPTPTDYGKVIKLRDVRGNFSSNPISIIAGSGDYVGGNSATEVINTDYSDITLTLSEGIDVSYDYQYVKGVTINAVPTASTGDTVLTKSFLLTSLQSDFLDIFDGVNYNIENLEVLINGNKLFYGEPSIAPPTADSDYGSIGGGSSLIPLNGTDIRLREARIAGTVISFKTYVASIGATKTTYQNYNVLIKTIAGTDTNGSVLYNIAANPTFTLAQLGAGGLEYNPGSFEVYVGRPDSGGQKILKEGEILDAPLLGAEFTWEPVIIGGLFTSFKINGTFSDEDTLEIKWLNGTIGTTLEFEGVDGIEEKTSALYMKTDIPLISRTDKIQYTGLPSDDITNAPDTDDTSIRFSDFATLFDTIYPIGTIYKNAHNPANPATYMGVGTWVAHQVGKVEIGFKTGDPIFGVHAGTGGSFDKTLLVTDIPELSSSPNDYIKIDPTGSIDLTGCNTDPDSSPVVVEPSEAIVNPNVTQTSVDITPEFVVVYSWRRVA